MPVNDGCVIGYLPGPTFHQHGAKSLLNLEFRRTCVVKLKFQLSILMSNSSVADV